MPTDTRAPEESAWILAVTSNVMMPCHLFRCLTESTSVVVPYTGKYADKPEFMSQLGTTITQMDCFYIVDWRELFHCIDEGCLCEVAKVQAPEEERSEDEIEQVDALDAPADAPVGSKRKTSDGTPRPPKKKKHRTPLKHPMPLLPWMLWPQKPSRRSHQRRRARNEFSEPFLMRGFYMVSIFLRSAGRKFCNLYFFGPATVPVRTRSAVCFHHILNPAFGGPSLQYCNLHC